MKKSDRFTKALAVLGAVLAWFPIVATIALSIIGSISEGTFLFDFLMPAELFPAALAGGLLLLWAAWRARRYLRAIGWGLVLMVGLLAGSQVVAMATGMATGETDPAGWPLALAVAGLAGYVAALIGVGVAGVLLVRDLFRS
jgi:hypothetical protein